MKKILLLMVGVILSLSLFGQKIGRQPYYMLRQLYLGDTIETKLIGDSVLYRTNQNRFVFNKQVQVNGDTIATRAYARAAGSGVASLNNGFLKWNSDSLSYFPYANPYLGAQGCLAYSDIGPGIILRDTSFGILDQLGEYYYFVGPYDFLYKSNFGCEINVDNYLGESYLLSRDGKITTINGYGTDISSLNRVHLIGPNQRYLEVNGNSFTFNKYDLNTLVFKVDTAGKTSLKNGSDSITLDPATGIKYYKGGALKFFVDQKGDIEYFYRHAAAGADSIAYTVGGTQNVFYKINTTALVIRDTLGVTVRGDSVLIQKSGDYWVSPDLAATTSNASDKLRVKLYRNNTPMSPSLRRFMINSLGTGNADTRNIRWYVKGLVVGDWLSFRVQNQTAARAVTITDFGLSVEYAHD